MSIKDTYSGREIPFNCPFDEYGAEGAPLAYDIDPGVGSGRDRLVRDWPHEGMVEELRQRGGSITPLWPLLGTPKDRSK